MPDITRIVLVGHCGFDAGSLSSFVRRVAPDVEIDSADDADDLEQFSGPENLLLINRALDYGFGSDDGIALIGRLAERSPAPRMMLISNYPEAQQRAEAAGAMPGFGKNQIGDEVAVSALREAMTATAS